MYWNQRCLTKFRASFTVPDNDIRNLRNNFANIFFGVQSCQICLSETLLPVKLGLIPFNCFAGMYDEDLLLGSRILVFSLSADAPCFAAMVLAAHYMGLQRANIVLLVQTMGPNSMVSLLLYQ